MEHLVALKNEQTARIVMRDTSLYVFLGTIFAVYAAEGQAGQNASLVELIRTCSTGLSAIMLTIYLSNDYYVSKIGDFVAADKDAITFKRWEDFHRSGWRHHVQKFFRTAIVLLLFGGWSLYQAIPVVQFGDAIARAVALLFGAIVVFQLAVFLSLALQPRATRESGETTSHSA